MLETFKATLSPMMVMFIFIVLGFIARKKKFVPENTAEVLSKLENNFFVPALIISTFMKYCTVSSIKEQYSLIIYCLIILVIAFAIGLPLAFLFQKKDMYKRNIYKYALIFGNFSFMGSAIVPQILGEEALYHYMLFILPLNIAVYAWGVVILIPKGETKRNPIKNLINPIFISIIIGAVLGLTGASNYLPDFIGTTVSGCAACMGPLAMILTGFVIGGYEMKRLLRHYKVYIATFLRLIVFPALFIVILKFLGADKEVLYLTLIAYGTPLGLNTVVFPAAYGADTKTGASMAMISHTLCIITIPIMYALVTQFA